MKSQKKYREALRQGRKSRGRRLPARGRSGDSEERDHRGFIRDSILSGGALHLAYDDRDLPTVESFALRLEELIRLPRPARLGQFIAKAALKAWHATGDAQWLVRLSAVRETIRDDRGCPNAGMRHDDAKRFERWFEKLLEREHRRAAWSKLSPQGRAATIRSLEIAERRIEAATDPRQRRRWQWRVDKYCARLREDAVLRYKAARGASDPRQRRVTETCRVRAIELGWVPETTAPRGAIRAIAEKS
jgi:hypothetical protein